MKHPTSLLAAFGLAHALLMPAQAQTPLEIAMQAIGDLAQLNGRALACTELKSARRAKDLMVAHAPKTARFGDAYEEGTQQSYASQINTHAACPDTATFSAQLEALEKRLQIALPVTSTGKQ